MFGSTAMKLLQSEGESISAHYRKGSPIAPPGTALILEDNEGDAAIVRELLENCCAKKFTVTRACTLKGATHQLSRQDFDVVLVDLDLPDSAELDTVRKILRTNPNAPVIVLTGHDSIDIAIKALQLGAQDYLPKSQLDNRALQRVIEYSILRKEKETELTSKAYFDGLTGLANRALLYERWRRSLALSKRAGWKTGVLVADIDNFKQVNDQFGHLAGDALLRDFAKRLTHSVRESDFVARLGGDEFVIVLENIRAKPEVDGVRDTLTDLAEKSFDYDSRRIRYTASIGGAITDPRDCEDLREVIKRADMEMYEFKAKLKLECENH